MNTRFNTEAKWYVVYTYPNSEKKIHDELLRRAIYSFLPTCKVVRQWSDRKKHLDVPLFPNYIFVKIHLEATWQVLALTGVVRFLTLDGQLIIVPNAEIDRVRMLTANNQDVCNANALDKEAYMDGERVRVIQGPLQGIEGSLVSKKGTSRLYVELYAINRLISVEMPADYVERLTEPMLRS